MHLLRTSGMVMRRLGRIVIAIVFAYVLWIMLSTLASSAEAARIGWFALVFTGLVALSRIESRRGDETSTSPSLDATGVLHANLQPVRSSADAPFGSIASRTQPDNVQDLREEAIDAIAENAAQEGEGEDPKPA